MSDVKIGMLIVTSSWREEKTFKMIPVTKDCPYNECIFDPKAKMLAIVSKEKKENFHMLPKISEYGDLVSVKNGKRPGGKDYAEQRVLLDTYYEYFIEDKQEILDFVKLFAINANEFAYKAMVEAAFHVTPTITQEAITV